eukprot:5830958-Pleurochrysis_carterae.AAC.1
MAERGGVPVRRLAEGVSSHLRSSGSDSRPRLYCVDCSVGQETNFQPARAVSPGKELAFDTFWERGHELPPFKVDNDSAVDFLLAALSSHVGTVVKHSLSVVTEAVAVKIHELLTSEQRGRVSARPCVRICRNASSVHGAQCFALQ